MRSCTFKEAKTVAIRVLIAVKQESNLPDFSVSSPYRSSSALSWSVMKPYNKKASILTKLHRAFTHHIPRNDQRTQQELKQERFHSEAHIYLLGIFSWTAAQICNHLQLKLNKIIILYIFSCLVKIRFFF